MWWSAFSYDKKDSHHIWKLKTAAQKKICELELQRINDALKLTVKAEWKLKTSMRRMSLRNKKDRKSVWKWDKKHEKVTWKDKKEEIDWYQYQKEILLSKLISFAQKCKIDCSDTMIQKNKAFAYASHFQNIIFMNAAILRLLWSVNSLNLNAIKLCWWWMKRRTTLKEASRNRITMIKAWVRCWEKEFIQKWIQIWISRISRHI